MILFLVGRRDKDLTERMWRKDVKLPDMKPGSENYAKR